MPDAQRSLDHVVDVLRCEAMDEVAEAVRVATDAYATDPDHNEGAVFGYVFWKNLTTRLLQRSGVGGGPLKWGGDLNDRWFRVGLDFLRFHRVDPNSLVPYNGDATKALARRVDGGGTPDLFLDEFGEPKVPMAVGRNLVVGVVATPYHGLQRVTVGELVQFGGSQRYGYDGLLAEVWGDFVQPTATLTLPVEEVPEVPVTLRTDLPKTGDQDDRAGRASSASL